MQIIDADFDIVWKVETTVSIVYERFKDEF